MKFTIQRLSLFVLSMLLILSCNKTPTPSPPKIIDPPKNTKPITVKLDDLESKYFIVHTRDSAKLYILNFERAGSLSFTQRSLEHTFVFTPNINSIDSVAGTATLTFDFVNQGTNRIDIDIKKSEDGTLSVVEARYKLKKENIVSIGLYNTADVKNFSLNGVAIHWHLESTPTFDHFFDFNYDTFRFRKHQGGVQVRNEEYSYSIFPTNLGFRSDGFCFGAFWKKPNGKIGFLIDGPENVREFEY